MSERILIIKLGALGDLVLCMGVFAAIRAHHPSAEIALLTMPAFADFAGQMPWFDKVLLDPRPKLTQPLAWGKLLSDVRGFAPTRVYDLQGKFRQEILFWALGGSCNKNLEWSGAARGCSHPRLWPPVPGMHYTDFIAAQMERAGVFSCHSGHLDSGDPESRLVPLDEEQENGMPVFTGMTERVDLSWLDAPLEVFALPERYALLIPGCAPNRLYKRWPALHYALLAKKLRAEGLTVLAVGTKQDRDSISAICALAPDVVDLSGQTTLKQLAALARRADVVIGNDTGPTHLAAVVGARTIALMSDQVDPHWSSPRGPRTIWLQGCPLSALSVEEVWETMRG